MSDEEKNNNIKLESEKRSIQATKFMEPVQQEAIEEFLKFVERQDSKFKSSLNWDVFSKAIEVEQEACQEIFDNIIEGMTWEGSLAYQGMAAGELKRFPPEIPLKGFTEEISIIFFQKEHEWLVRLSDTQKIYTVFLIFLNETVEVGRVEVVSGDASEIPQECIDDSDRFIILQQET